MTSHTKPSSTPDSTVFHGGFVVKGDGSSTIILNVAVLLLDLLVTGCLYLRLDDPDAFCFAALISLLFFAFGMFGLYQGLEIDGTRYVFAPTLSQKAGGGTVEIDTAWFWGEHWRSEDISHFHDVQLASGPLDVRYGLSSLVLRGTLGHTLTLGPGHFTQAHVRAILSAKKTGQQ